MPLSGPNRWHDDSNDGDRLRVGCAGWSLPKEHAHRFPSQGTHLERYAARLPGVEINSSFYRPHRPATYARWAASVPDGFAFAVKVPREATHERRLEDADTVLDRFLAEATQLGGKLGPLLVQLPPSLPYSAAVAGRFFAALRDRFDGDVALEPRHRSWFEARAERPLVRHRIARVAADPAVVPAAAEPGGWGGLVYYRLHGSPQTYYSPYSDSALDALAEKLVPAAKAAVVWCVFDNTALGHATANALDVLSRVRAARRVASE
jgi:uncharacterized protein YecE (DUF72 family)